jgi:hypothetical protein
MGDTRAWKYLNKEIGCCMEHLLQQSEKGRLGGDHSCFKSGACLPACLPAGPPPVSSSSSSSGLLPFSSLCCIQFH